MLRRTLEISTGMRDFIPTFIEEGARDLEANRVEGEIIPIGVTHEAVVCARKGVEPI
jgi:hypothetical protein